MIKRKGSSAKQPYEGYTLPEVSEKGGQFVDFKRIMERKPVKVVKRRLKERYIKHRDTAGNPYCRQCYINIGGII
jgi:hypothetical protein